MYTHYQLQQPVEFYLIIVCRSRVGIRRAFAGTLDRPNYPGIQSDEDTGSYALRTHVLPAMRKLFTDDHDDHGDWTYGRRTFRMKDDGDKVSCVVNWNHPLPNAGAAAFALGKGRGVPDDSIQYALEYGGRINAKRFKRDPEQWVWTRLTMPSPMVSFYKLVDASIRVHAPVPWRSRMHVRRRAQVLHPPPLTVCC